MAPNRISTCDRIVSKNLNGISCKHSFVQWAIVKATVSLLLHLRPSFYSSDIFWVLDVSLELHVWSPVWCKDRWMVFAVFAICRKWVKYLLRDNCSIVFFPGKEKRPCLPASGAFLYGSDCWVQVPCAVQIIVWHGFPPESTVYV